MDESLEALQDLAERSVPDPHDYALASLRPHIPVDPPGQLFQAVPTIVSTSSN